MESTTEINPTLLRIWEAERSRNLSGGTDRHVAWCHGLIYRLALEMSDEQLAKLNSELEFYKEHITRPF